MNIELESAALHLPRGKSVRVRDGAGSTVQVLEGTIWITEENNPRDVVLGRGQRFRLARRGLAIVEAFGDSVVSLVTRPGGFETGATAKPPIILL
jgi:hypothetical protein